MDYFARIFMMASVSFSGILFRSLETASAWEIRILAVGPSVASGTLLNINLAAAAPLGIDSRPPYIMQTAELSGGVEGFTAQLTVLPAA